MVINNQTFKALFNAKELVHNLMFSLSCIFILFIGNIVVFYYTVIKIQEVYVERLNNIPVTNKNQYFESVFEKCIYLRCKYLVDAKKPDNVEFYTLNTLSNTKVVHLEDIQVFIVDRASKDIHFSMLTQALTNDLDIVLDIGYGYKIVLDTGKNIYILIYYKLIMFILVSVFIFLAVGYIKYLNYKKLIYEKRHYKTYVEDTVRGNMTEMLHHEIKAPLAILRVVISGIRDNKEINKIIEENKNDEKQKLQAAEFAVDRIEDMTNYLSNNNSFKRNNNVTIYEMLKHVINDINITNINKVNIDIDINKVDISDYVLNPNLTVSKFLNIITILFNNSVEAGANTLYAIGVEIKREYDSKYLILDIGDNGRGIRDINGELFKSSNDIIMKYGYSTKDKTKAKNKGIIRNLLYKLGIIFVDTDTSRGIGLYLCKSILKEVGGNIWLVRTSKDGTWFRLVVPVTEYER